MCPNQQLRNNKPYYNSVNESLFDNETDSDCTFLVGSYDRWRFPGHRSVLSQANPVFKAMLSHHQSSEPISIPDVDGRAFDLLLRHLYKEDVKIQSVSTALCTLYAAQKYLCAGLMGVCIAYLDRHMEVSNVLEIYHTMRLHCGQVDGVGQATAPPYEHLVAKRDPNDNLDSMLAQSTALLYNCCYFIDVNADAVLMQESVEDLPVDSLKDLIDRDSLCVGSEVSVYQAVERWANRECKRCQLELSRESRRSVVPDDLLFSVRYLRMSEKEFYSGPMSGNLLTPQEVRLLLGLIMSVPNGNTAISLTDEVLAKIARRRVFPLPPHHMAPPNSAAASDPGAKPKKKQKGKQKKEKSSNAAKCSGSCALDYVVRGLACLFD